MRIACLQFAPQVGDVDNNLNRADSVLAKANPDDLEDLDLLVLPELAFTGYNFKSLAQISPFLEPQGFGISALWARTTALKYDTNVIVGYPERVDVAPKWPTGPEFYNSAIVVNGNGETIANYRKSFLYTIDETWALEGEHGFFGGEIPGLGNTAMGICMDLNPYRFEAPWNAFEFAFHVQEMESNLVIVTMAWLTREDGRHFSRMPEDPDLETLTYWVQRLEPLIRAEGKEEVIVIFCNRTGTEGDLVYAGTSSVVGIKDGEVNVYGILGRGVKDLLVVDTNNGPFAKLLQIPEGESDMVSQASGVSRRPRQASAVKPSISRNPAEQPFSVYSGPRRPTPEPGSPGKSRRKKPDSPRIQIPSNPYQRQCSASNGTPIEESPGVATPTCPSPTPHNHRLNIIVPDVRATENDVPDTLYSAYGTTQDHPHIYGGQVSIDQPTPVTASPTSGRVSEKYFWLDDQPPLKSPMMSRFPDVYQQSFPTSATPMPTSLVKIHHEKSPSLDLDGSRGRTHLEHPGHQDSVVALSNPTDNQGGDCAPPRPSSPKSRNASRTGRPLSRRFSEVEQPDLTGTVERLESLARRPGSAMDLSRPVAEEPFQGRLQSRQSRHSIHIDRPLGFLEAYDHGSGKICSTEMPFLASPRTASEMIERPPSRLLRASERSLSRNAAGAATINPCPRAGARSWNRSNSENRSARSQPRSGSSVSRSSADPEPHIEPDETRTLVWSELSKLVGEVLDQPQSREVSRGRHRAVSHHSLAAASGPGRETKSETRVPRSVPPPNQRFASQDRRGPIEQRPMRSVPAPNGVNGQSAPFNPDDEIVAEIIFHAQQCPAHIQINSPGHPNGATPSRASNPTRPALGQREVPRQEKNSNSTRVSRRNTPQAKRPSPSRPGSVYDKYSSYHDEFDVVDIYKSRTPPRNATRTEGVGSCPTMDDASILTVTTGKSSPATPPLNIFEPTTPKAMKFDHESGTVLTSYSDPLSGGRASSPVSIERDLMGIGTFRPKSAVW